MAPAVLYFLHKLFKCFSEDFPCHAFDSIPFREVRNPPNEKKEESL